MRTDYHNLLKKQVTLAATDAVWLLECAICESIQSATGGNPSDKNIFGRPLSFSGSHDISYSIGYASTGLRAGIILHPEDLSSNIENITAAVRTHIPLVIFAGIRSQFQVHQLAQCGVVVFSAVTAKEACDLLLASFQIAELSLLPVVVCMEEALLCREETFEFPGKELLAEFAGNTDHFISSPTPAQQMIFGNKRKRIPNWFNPDNPVSIGASKPLHEAALETAAQEEYFYEHLDHIIQDTFAAFNKKAFTTYNDIELTDTKNTDHLIISFGSIASTVSKAAEEFRSKHKTTIAAARLIRISPFPEAVFKKILVHKKAATVLEQATSGIRYARIYKEIACLPESRHLKLFSGNYGSIPSADSISGVISNMLPGGKEKNLFWLDLEFVHPDSKYPKHQVLMQAIEREYPDAKNKTLNAPAAIMSKQPASNYIPLLIRKHKDQGPAYAKLSRFYDDTASFFLTDPEELTADPFQATPVMPPSTAHFYYNPAELKLLPVFSPSNCSGCGDCFLHCPHAAINPLAISMENLLKAGMAIAASGGTKITQLTPMLKNMAKNLHEGIQSKNGKINTVSELLAEAFEKTTGQMKLEGDKLQAAKQDIEAVISALKELPVSVTNIFYNIPDLIKKGNGELFSLSIDVNACTGCSVCANTCREDALNMTEADPNIQTVQQAQFALWEQLPDTPAETITYLLDDNNYNPFSAILLSRQYNQALNGSSREQEGDASKAMAHLVLALAEAVIQPRVKEAIKALDDLVFGLSQNIHTQLSAALPSKDLDALAGVLSDIKEDRKPFDEVIGKLGSEEHLKLVDTKSLKRKVELTKSLRMLHGLLSEGSSGTGRARMGIATDASFDWSDSYPWNNFIAPVFIHKGGAGTELAMGIVQGHIRQILDNIKMIRRAELEIKGKYEPEIHDIQIASITWNDLTEKEKALVPPILVIGNKEKMGMKDPGALLNLLDGNWPVKLVIFDDAAPGTTRAAAEITASLGALLPALALGKVPVLKSSLAVPQHLFAGLSEQFNNSGAAIAWVFAPSASKHWTPATSYPKLHALSLDARTFPVFDFNPQREGPLLSSKMEMDVNPQPASDWMQSELSYTENGEEKTLAYSLTWADWAYTLRSWKEKYQLHLDTMGEAVQVAEFLSLPDPERAGKCPVIFRIDLNGELKKYWVPEEAIKATQACAKSWQVLREISGELTEFPEKLEEKTEAELSVKYENKLSETRNEYESRIMKLEQEYLERIRIKLKEKLVALSQYTKHQ